MGEQKQKRSATERFVRDFTFCCLCGGNVPATTREHVPPKALFDRSHRPDRLVVPSCHRCNGISSTADLVVSLISRWRFGDSSPVEATDHSRLAYQLSRQAPEIRDEWTSLGLIERKRVRREFEEAGFPAPDRGYVKLGAKTWPHVHLFAHKLTLGIFFDLTKRAVPAYGAVRAWARPKEVMFGGGLPKEILALLGPPAGLSQGQWDTAEQFQYRYAYNRPEGLFLHVSRLRTGVFMMGMAINDAGRLPQTELHAWISPASLPTILEMERFKSYF